MTAEELLPLVNLHAVRLAGRLPRGLDADDLRSVGNEAIVEAMARYDSDRTEMTHKQFAEALIKQRMRDFIRQNKGSRRKARVATVGFAEDADTGGQLLPGDPKVNDPADIAAAREELCGAALANVEVGGAVVTPAVAAIKARRLQDAVLAAVGEQDIRDAMGAVVRKAKRGNLKATQLLLRIIGLPPQPARVNAVQVNIHDVD